MSKLIVHNNSGTHELHFEGRAKLSELLSAENLMPATPCGGVGKCGKCTAFEFKEGSDDQSHKILTCQAFVEGDTEIFIPKNVIVSKIRTEGNMPDFELDPVASGIGCAVDIGTTTVVLRLINLDTGEMLPAVSVENPQRAIAADVINRIQAALHGKDKLLQHMIQNTVNSLLDQACKENKISKDSITAKVITGNTTMLYLYTGRLPVSLAKVPYTADHTFGSVENGVYYPPCFGAFVGADIYTAILASDMVHRGEVSLLIDLGTNGEIALYNKGHLSCCATACGPAFEGTGIECGGPATDGAIDHVWIEDGAIRYSVIGGNLKPTHLCGSAIIDAVASLLELGHISENGRLDQDRHYLAEDVYISKQDIRQIQLAKSAICAGIITLIEINGLTPKDIEAFYIAGGFGAYLKLESADKIGLMPSDLLPKTTVIGNAALSGAILTLLDKTATSALGIENSTTINLAATEQFSDLYIENMLFDV